MVHRADRARRRTVLLFFVPDVPLRWRADAGSEAEPMGTTALARRAAQRAPAVARYSCVVLALTVLAPNSRSSPCIRTSRSSALFGFHAWYGLLACAAMIVVAKVLGVRAQAPGYDYYEADDE